MVRGWLMLALAAHGVVEAATLTARLDRTVSALGEPITLTVEARGASLDALDMNALLRDFDVAARTLGREASRETLALTLYPRRSGTLHVPPLHLDALRTAPLTLAVADGSDAVSRVAVSWSIEPAEPRVKEPARLTLALCDDGSLQWQRPELATTSGRVVRSLGEDEGPSRSGDAECTLHRYYWALTPTQAGAASLAVPMLDAARFGERLRFPAPELRYRAHALPGWLPAHVPPVAPQVRTTAVSPHWPLNRPLTRHFDVTGGHGAEDLRALLTSQLRDTPELAVYPPTIREVSLDDTASPLLRHAVTLHFTPRASGQVTLPELVLPWFDTTRGVPARVIVPGREVTVFDPRWHRALQIGGMMLGGLLAFGGLRRGRDALRWRLARRRGLRAVLAAGDAHALAHAVRGFSLRGDATAPSLGAWRRRMMDETGTDGFDVAIGRLQRWCYGQADDDLADLKRAFVSGLARARPRRRATQIRG